MGKPLRILHLEDNPRDVELIQAILEADSVACDVTRVQTRDEFDSALSRGGWDVIFSDFALPAFNGRAALALAREKSPQVPFILISGTVGEEVAVESLHDGATDYLLKQRLERLPAAVRRALRENEAESVKKQAEDALRASEECFRAFMENSSAIAFIKDETGRFVYLNKRVEELSRFKRAELLGKRMGDVLPGESARHAEELDAQVFATGKPLEAVEEVPEPDGRVRYWLVSRFLTRDASGHRLLGGLSMDITERRQAEQRIREQAALLDQAHDAILVLDLEQQITFWNQGAVRLYGWRSQEAIGKKAAELFAKIESSDPEAGRLTIEKGEWIGELQQMTKSGKEVIVESRRTLLRDDQGNPKSVLIINNDITAKARLEAQFLRAQRMESIGTLAGGIAHDLNNVLTPILMAVQLLRAKLSDPADLQLADTLESSAQRGANMVKQILSFARGVQGERTVLQLRHLATDMLKVARETFPCSIEIRSELARDLWTVVGDATQLYQVLMNLCVNARDAMPGGGVLNVEIENLMLDENFTLHQVEARPGPYVALTVSDTGTGIPPQIIDKIFDPFFTTKAIGIGTGLGLSTTLGIIKSHGGFVTVYSEVAKGTVFKVYLPAAAVLETDQAKPARAILPAGRNELVLVVDDEPTVREVTKRILLKNTYRVLTASDGTEAVALYARHCDEIKVVITDMAMPFLDGPATIRALQRLNSKARIIAVSGAAENAKLAELLREGSISFLQKPYTTEQLLKTLSAVLNGKGPGELTPAALF
jgi:PAS domain S-box-containing protein